MLALGEVLAASEQKPELAHVLDFQGQGILDQDWIPRIAQEGWIVITGDRGKSGGQKLPLLCRRFFITHVLLSAAVHRQRGFEKQRAILHVWPEIALLPQMPKGSGFSLRLSSAGTAKLVKIYDGGPAASQSHPSS